MGHSLDAGGCELDIVRPGVGLEAGVVKPAIPLIALYAQPNLRCKFQGSEDLVGSSLRKRRVVMSEQPEVVAWTDEEWRAWERACGIAVLLFQADLISTEEARRLARVEELLHPLLRVG